MIACEHKKRRKLQIAESRNGCMRTQKASEKREILKPLEGFRWPIPFIRSLYAYGVKEWAIMKQDVCLFTMTLWYLSSLLEAADFENEFKGPDKSQWIDPTDMIYDVQQQKQDLVKKRHKTEEKSLENLVESEMLNPSCSKDLQRCRDEYRQLEKQLQQLGAKETPYFKQFSVILQGYLNKFQYQSPPDEKLLLLMELSLSGSDLELLKNFTSGQARIQDVHSMLVESIVGAREAAPEPSTIEYAGDFLKDHSSILCQIVVSVAVISLSFSSLVRYQISWWAMFYRILIMAFIISVPWNWWHLYKLESARRYADMLQEAPADCKPKHEQSLWQALSSALSVDVDACTKYQQRMMIDPVWEIPPTKALAVTITKFCVEPVEHIGTALNLFLQKTLVGLPFYLWPVAIVFAVLVLVLTMVMMFGYRLNLFYLCGIEPGQPRVSESEIRHLREEVARLRLEKEDAAERERYRAQALHASRSLPALAARVPALPPLVESLGVGIALDECDSSSCATVKKLSALSADNAPIAASHDGSGDTVNKHLSSKVDSSSLPTLHVTSEKVSGVGEIVPQHSTDKLKTRDSSCSGGCNVVQPINSCVEEQVKPTVEAQPSIVETISCEIPGDSSLGQPASSIQSQPSDSLADVHVKSEVNKTISHTEYCDAIFPDVDTVEPGAELCDPVVTGSPPSGGTSSDGSSSDSQGLEESFIVLETNCT